MTDVVVLALGVMATHGRRHGISFFVKTRCVLSIWLLEIQWLQWLLTTFKRQSFVRLGSLVTLTE